MSRRHDDHDASRSTGLARGGNSPQRNADARHETDQHHQIDADDPDEHDARDHLADDTEGD